MWNTSTVKFNLHCAFWHRQPSEGCPKPSATQPFMTLTMALFSACKPKIETCWQCGRTYVIIVQFKTYRAHPCYDGKILEWLRNDWWERGETWSSSLHPHICWSAPASKCNQKNRSERADKRETWIVRCCPHLWSSQPHWLQHAQCPHRPLQTPFILPITDGQHCSWWMSRQSPLRYLAPKTSHRLAKRKPQGGIGTTSSEGKWNDLLHGMWW